MKRLSQPLLKDFHEEIREEFPDLTHEQLREAVYGPWKFLKNQIESGELLTVRFKYFGTFVVYEGRAKALLNRLEKSFKEHKIEPQEYFKMKKMLEGHLKKKEDAKQMERE